MASTIPRGAFSLFWKNPDRPVIVCSHLDPQTKFQSVREGGTRVSVCEERRLSVTLSCCRRLYCLLRTSPSSLGGKMGGQKKLEKELYDVS
ncbi:hypothetical protein CDAR_183061 [Caerostris darwini]|uniref:Uncharacterized protein n=1 Tax=Caerostris darwini TaxID=1538125 RepID=A0AAV4T1U2_9ARAC|nr:hypothetical protein CDAR_183061 [Caerostris darwini]